MLDDDEGANGQKNAGLVVEASDDACLFCCRDHSPPPTTPHSPLHTQTRKHGGRGLGISRASRGPESTGAGGADWLEQLARGDDASGELSRSLEITISGEGEGWRKGKRRGKGVGERRQ
jgi:hypothetical protein